MENKLNYLIVLGGVLLGLMMLVVYNTNNTEKDSDATFAGGLNYQSCIPTTTTVAVGPQVSVEILATSTNRAWARVEGTNGFPLNATTTAYVSLSNTASSTNANSIILTGTSTPELKFGRNTELPYVGSVRAHTSSASTTLKVTECNYPI